MSHPEERINYTLAEGFEIKKDGVWYLKPTQQGLETIFICGLLYVVAYARDERHENYCKLLEFTNHDGQVQKWLMPQELLAGDGGEVRKALLSKGLKLGEDRKAKELLHRYLLSCDPPDRVRSVDRTGWYGQTYVLPKGTLGKQPNEEVLYLGPSGGQMLLQYIGSAEDWKNNVGSLCVGNSRLIFGVSVALAAPLLGICYEENGGFHLRGASSTGKTTILYAAASVFGGKDFIQRWRATANGLEATAKMHNDLVLLLDEMGEIHPKDAGEVAYMLGNGTGKARADKSGSARDKAKWRCLFLSTGEVSLAQHMLEDGKKARAGQETRIADIPADLGAFGVFDALHGASDGALFANLIKDKVREYHGAVGWEYIRLLSEDFEIVRNAVDATIDMFIADHVPNNASGQVKRVGRRFGLVAAAGELATFFNITGWDKGAAIEAVGKCFQDWLENRGDDRDLEERKILSQVQHFFESHGGSRFSPWQEDPNFRTFNRAGFKKIENDKTEYYVLEEVFKNEICLGVDWKRAAKLLIAGGFLLPSTDGKSTRTENLPGLGRVRCYRFSKIPMAKADGE
jgi:putative DNA primase/helicase